LAKTDQPKADNSIWRKSGHFYFALTPFDAVELGD